MTKYPHVPAAFINAIREEGTKTEACNFLQEQWNETCALRAALAAEKTRADAAEALVKGRTFTVDPIAEALAKQTSHGERQEHSRIGHALAESSWHVHLAGFVSRAHAEQALAALAQQPPTSGAGDDQGSE